MRKILSNKVYDTETAKLVANYRSDYAVSDFNYYEEALYKKRTGEYFLHGEGNGMSKYADSYGDLRGPGEKIIPLPFEEAREWAERKLEAEEYELEFGIPDEGETEIFTRVPNDVYALMEKEKSENSISLKDIIVDALEKRYQ